MPGTKQSQCLSLLDAEAFRDCRETFFSAIFGKDTELFFWGSLLIQAHEAIPERRHIYVPYLYIREGMLTYGRRIITGYWTKRAKAPYFKS